MSPPPVCEWKKESGRVERFYTKKKLLDNSEAHIEKFPLGCLYNNDKVLVFQDFIMCTAIFLYFLKSPVRQDVNKFKKMCIESSMRCHVFVFFL